MGTIEPGKLFTPMQGGGYVTIDETGKWDLDMIKKVMDINPGLFKQEYTAEFKEKKSGYPIKDWVQKWIKNEKSNNSI